LCINWHSLDDVHYDVLMKNDDGHNKGNFMSNKPISRWMIGIVSIAILVGVITFARSSAQDDLAFSGELAFGHVETQIDFGPRVTGTEGWRSTQAYIIENLEAHGWSITTQTFTVETPHDGIITGENIIAMRGQGPITVIGTHYDTRLVSDKDEDPDNYLIPMPGANDGGSGVGVMLELSRIIDEHYDSNEQIWLIFFDAEDNPGGIVNWPAIPGSIYLVDNLADLEVTADDFRFALVLDMVGEAGEQNFYYETASIDNAPTETERLWELAATLGYEANFIPEIRYSIVDDHRPFISGGIPASLIIDFDYLWHHTTEDTLDKVSAEALARIGRVVEFYLVDSGVVTQR
jgi:Zn-dependent M28 family amino/carboxypeptidase